MVILRRALLVLFAALLYGASSDVFAADSSPDIEQLLKQLRATLIRVQGEIATKRLPELKSVQINLQTALKVTGGGKITFFVISVGDTTSLETTQSFKIILSPPKVTGAQVASTQDFSKEFGDAIVAVAQTIANASAQKPELRLTTLSASIKFVSETKVEAGITKVQLLPVSIDLGGAATPANTHEAIINFGG